MLDADCLALLARKPEPDPTPKQTEDCADKAATQKYNYRSLAQSARSADAAVYSAYIGYLQTSIGIIGALLVTATLIASAGATFAALGAARGTIEAARATRDSVDLARRSFAHTHRPRLRVRRIVVPRLVEGEAVTVEGQIANVGDTDAVLRVKAVVVRVGRNRASVLYDQPEPPFTGTAADPPEGSASIEFIRAGAHTNFTLTTNLIYRNEPRFYVEGMVIGGKVLYSDVYPGKPYDLPAKQDFKSTDRLTAFERVFVGKVGGGPPYRFVRREKPDPEREYED